jgi:hypothetical protein
MPTIARIRGYRFFFFSLDRTEPIHVHVDKGEAYAKYWLRPVALTRSRAFRSNELSEIQHIIEENADAFEEKWHEFFAGDR